jgi:hypothetical protein
MRDHSRDNDDLKLILSSMKMTAWVMYVATELVFIRVCAAPQV